MSPPNNALPLLAAALLAACAVSPDYQRPATTRSTIYGDESLSSLQANAEQQLLPGQNPAPDWWTQFQCEPLNATMQQALAGNRSLAAASASLAQAREAVTASTGQLYPQLTLDAGAGRQQYGAQFSGPNRAPPFNYFSVGPSVRYLFDYTGGQHRAVEQQQALAESQAFQLQAAQLSLTGNVAQQALMIASMRAQIATLEGLLEEDQKNLTLVQSAFDAGSVSRVDVLSAQSQLATDQTLLPPLRQQLSLARHAMSVLVGHAPGDWAPPDFELADLQLPASLPLSLPSELAHRRPDILAAESQLHAATAGAGVATSNLYPQINLTASVSQQSTSLSHLFDGDSLAWGFAGGLTAPLFDGGSLRAQSRAAQNAQQAALAQYQQVVLQSFGQVADVLAALDHDAEQLTAQRNALDTSEANLKLTRESYAAGNVGVLQVLDAGRLSQQARLGYVRAQAQRYQDTTQLFVALGGAVIPVSAEPVGRQSLADVRP
ncbi:MAG: transporter [Hydrocarboniphaga sp.]|uniref:efflux transporter outer membrane subunit n=1 Tax=Hydrocarboniphaga sp. TaxID=2033016 RepID=UPI0026274453|nr:efflux transporter outer membrane subunit [Hydrocarboniphaga sp.]MDB5973033.1 transporter [Hydrocarboniphaga sp.]